MSELGDKRRQFSRMATLLCHYAEFLGYEYSFEYTKRCEDCPIGHPKSTHGVGLALVITSYSIHYTKLYEFRRYWRKPPRPVDRAGAILSKGLTKLNARNNFV